ncbi:MAG: hypothetical protein GDA56_12670 [Hormoscilla sp. GM7CHS1pb]|nr:hypothetical protein [Hormoscilla sp. GM7CHS1pb]
MTTVGALSVVGPLVPTALPGNGFGRQRKYEMHPLMINSLDRKNNGDLT